MAPTWLPKWSQDGRKIHQNFDHFLDASWDRFFDDFWSIFWSKMEASWSQNRSKIDVNFEKRFFQKTLFFLRKNKVFWDPMAPSWASKSIKNQPQNEVNLGRHLGTDFSSILVVLGNHVGSQKGFQIVSKRCQKMNEILKAFGRPWGRSRVRFCMPRPPKDVLIGGGF